MRLALIGFLFAAASFARADDCAVAPDTVFADGYERHATRVRYVAVSGNDADAGTIDAPWASVQHAANVAEAGDTVCVRGGAYPEVVTIARSGSLQGGPVTLQSMPGETAIIDGSGLAIPDAQYGLVTLVDASYVTLRGFEVRNFSTASVTEVPIGIYLTGAGSGVRLIGNHIHDIRTSGAGCAANAFGLKVDGTRAPQSINQLEIAGNEIDHLVLGCSESFSLDGNVEQWTIRGNVIHDTNNIGIGAIGFEGVAPDPAYDQARDGVISDNTVYAITSFGNPAYGDQYAADGIYVDGGTRITIERNRVHGVDIGIELASEHAGKLTSDVTARNNLVYGNQSAGLSIGGYATEAGGTEGCTLVGNTLFRNDTAQTGSGEVQIQFHASGNRIANNLVYAGAQGVLLNAFTGDSAMPATLDHNLYFSDAPAGALQWTWRGTDYADFDLYRSASGEDAASLLAAPGFLDPGLPDLRVAPASPAVGAGTDLGEPIVGAVDFAGNPRVVSAIDIGAYEQ